MALIYADFMKCDDRNRLVLTTNGTNRDLAKHGIALREGLHLVFYNEDEDDSGKRDNLVVEGKIQYDEDHKRWVAEIDWDAIKNISRLTDDERAQLGLLAHEVL